MEQEQRVSIIIKGIAYNQIAFWENGERKYGVLFSEDGQSMMVNYPLGIPLKLSRSYFGVFLDEPDRETFFAAEPRLILEQDINDVKEILSRYEIFTVLHHAAREAVWNANLPCGRSLN